MRPLVEPGLVASAPCHGFGLRGTPEPAGLARPRQVHGAAVARAADCLKRGERPAADVVVAATPGVPVGVLTADCVPLLLASRAGNAVAAVHAGWRGLAAGVVAAGVEALASAAGVGPEQLLAAIGPHIGPCCYEVDDAVLDALAARHEQALERALRPARAGHAMLDLGALVGEALERAGVPQPAVGRAAASCTCCDSRRFHSYRRDGIRAGRLVHFIAASALEG
jgi:YfiH family protein